MAAPPKFVRVGDRYVLGFTGTRVGMSLSQKEELRKFLRQRLPAVFHHGDCIGADQQAHRIVRELAPECTIIAHPCDLPYARAHCNADVVCVPLKPLVRNAIIVDACQVLVAAPEHDEEKLRSGTWATVRMARRSKKKVTLLLRGH
jgi:hypothetical protein